MSSNRSKLNDEDTAPVEFVSTKLRKMSGKTAKHKIATTSNQAENLRRSNFGCSFNSMNSLEQDNVRVIRAAIKISRSEDGAR